MRSSTVTGSPGVPWEHGLLPQPLSPRRSAPLPPARLSLALHTSPGSNVVTSAGLQELRLPPGTAAQSRAEGPAGAGGQPLTPLTLSGA